MFPKQIIQNPNNIIIGHNIKFDIKKLEQHFNIKHQCKLYDTSIMQSMIDENSMDNSLKALASIYTNLGHYEDNISMDKIRNQEEPLEKVIVYNCLDSIVPLKLFEKLYPELQKQGLVNIFEFITEMLSIFVEVEQNGIYINQDKLIKLLKTATQKVKELENKYVKLNLGSSTQLITVLYKTLKLPILQYTKKKKPSTDKDALLELKYKLDHNELVDHEELREYQKQFINDILEYRKAIKNVEHLTNIATNIYNGRVHTSYNLGRNFDESSGKERGTVTGRLSSSDPNLQNIPTESEVREIFEVSPNYKYFVCADYSQIELRWAAFLSREPNLIKAFKEGKDVHTSELCDIQGWNYDEVNHTLKEEIVSHPRYKDYSDYRLVIKRVQFGIIYGIAEDHLAKVLRQMGVSLQRNKITEIISDWKFKNQVLMQWLKQTEDLVISQGYLRTAFGRIRHLIGGNRHSSQGLRVLRQGINFPIQSAASDTCLLGIKNLYTKNKVNNCFKLLMTVHDEISFETNLEDKELIKEMIIGCMTDSVIFNMKSRFGIDFDIPLEVDIHIGNCWKK